MDAELLRRGCKRAGLVQLESGKWALFNDTGTYTWSWWEEDPALPAYVAERLVEMVRASDKAWQYDVARGDNLGADCWVAAWSQRSMPKVIAQECLFVEHEDIDGASAGRHVNPDGCVVLWCRGEEDNDPFCGRTEVEIVAALEVLGDE